MALLNLDHIHYRTSDFEQSRNFYVDIMGATDLGAVELAGKLNLQFVLAGATLLFALAVENPVSPVPESPQQGIYHIAFLVDDCVATTNYYTARGAKLAHAPFMASNNIKASFLYAPDGMMIELEELVFDQPAT